MEKMQLNIVLLRAWVHVTALLLINVSCGALMSLQDAVRKPVIVSVMTDHFMGAEYARMQENCMYKGHMLSCNWVDGQRSNNMRNESDMLWFHGPTFRCAVGQPCMSLLQR